MCAQDSFCDEEAFTDRCCCRAVADQAQTSLCIDDALPDDPVVMCDGVGHSDSGHDGVIVRGRGEYLWIDLANEFTAYRNVVESG